MRLSTRTRYGARALAELALAYPDATLSVGEVAARQGISPKYLEQIMRTLRATGLVRAVRGMHGGYALSRPPDETTLGEVFRVLEGSPAPVDCVDDPRSCPMGKVCPTRDTWVEISQAIQGILASTTLQDLAQRKTNKSEASALMYHI